MRPPLILSFELPRGVVRLAGRLGVRLVTRASLAGDDRVRYLAAGAGPWIEAHEVLKRALDSAHAARLDGPPLAATRVSGLPPERVAHRFTQQLNAAFGFDVLFLATARATLGGGVVLPAPAAFRRHLAGAGLPTRPLLSALAWGVAALGLLAEGVAAHVVHARRAVDDEMRPDRLPEWARHQVAGAWPATDPGAFAADPARLNVGDFVRTGAVAPFRDCGVVVVETPEAGSRVEPPLVAARHVLAARRGPGGDRAALGRMLAEQLRLVAALAGGGAEILLARETALLPSARLHVAEMRPKWIIGALPNIAGPNLWHELARQAGSRLFIVANSAQATSIHRRDEMRPGHVPHIYMHPVADGFGAWTPTHARALARFGIAAETIEVGGPMIFSARPPRRAEPVAGRPLRVDYFDQVPPRSDAITGSGVPGFYWTAERLIRTVQDVVAALDGALPPGGFRLRIKSKKLTAGVDSGYFRAIAALAEAHPSVEVVAWRTSALTLNADSDLTIGFPFASPVVSAAWYGVPACFYDADGLAFQDPLIVDGLPVLTGVDALAEWIGRHRPSLPQEP